MPKPGPRGAVGIQGLMGVTGATGPQGPVGAENFAFTTFVFSGTSQVVPAQGTVLFPTTNVIQGNISYNALTGVFTLGNEGYYLVHYGVSGSPNNDQVALKLNSDILPITGSAIDIQSSLLQGIIVVFNVTTPMSTLKLINNESSANITINAANSDSVAAYLLIQQL